MINLFNINNYIIDTSKLRGLHDNIVSDFENDIASFVGAKYGCGFSSATNAIFLALLEKDTTIEVPSILPPVVCNAIKTSGNNLAFRDDIKWVGDSYVLHDFKDYKIIDSAQKIVKNQFISEANPQDLMIFSFYPTKPIGSFDGGIIVSNDKDKIDFFKMMVMNGCVFDKQSWKRKTVRPGFKMYLNAIQAYIGNENFKKLDEKYEALDRIKQIYNSEFNLNNDSYHLYRLNVNDRAKFLKKANQQSVEMGIHYEALHVNPIYCNGGKALPMSDKESKTTISIPFHECLTDKEIEKVINLVKSHGYYKNT
jgi:dTDP-4-amino-4,6-dideoxygalactose transaminase